MSHLNSAAFKKDKKHLQPFLVREDKNIARWHQWLCSQVYRADAQSVCWFDNKLLGFLLWYSIWIVVAVVVEVKIVSHCYYYYYRKVFLDLITNCYTSSTADRPLQVNIDDAKVKIHKSSQGVMIPNKRLCHHICYHWFGGDKEILGYWAFGKSLIEIVSLAVHIWLTNITKYSQQTNQQSIKCNKYIVIELFYLLLDCQRILAELIIWESRKTVLFFFIWIILKGFAKI